MAGLDPYPERLTLVEPGVAPSSFDQLPEAYLTARDALALRWLSRGSAVPLARFRRRW